MTLLEEIRDKCSPELLAARDDGAIAAKVSEGRTRIASKEVSERGVRSALSIVEASAFMKLLRDTTQADTIPPWLDGVCGALGIPQLARGAYFETIQCAFPWLRQTGLDVGAATTRSMLDLIAAGNPALVSACTKIKALAEQPDPVDAFTVRRAIWADNGDYLP